MKWTPEDSEQKPMVYKIQLKVYIGLSHGAGDTHYPPYSPKVVEQILDESKSANATLLRAEGREGGKGEETVIIEMIWPPLDITALGKKCEAVNDFVQKVFQRLFQRWILCTFITTTVNGTPLKTDSIELTPDGRPTIQVSDLIPEEEA
jgi:hypothetical protein